MMENLVLMWNCTMWREDRQWIIDFPNAKLPQIYDLLGQYGEGKEIHIFHSRDDADKFLKKGILNSGTC